MIAVRAWARKHVDNLQHQHWPELQPSRTPSLDPSMVETLVSSDNVVGAGSLDRSLRRVSIASSVTLLDITHPYPLVVPYSSESSSDVSHLYLLLHLVLVLNKFASLRTVISKLHNTFRQCGDHPPFFSIFATLVLHSSSFWNLLPFHCL